MYDISIDDKYLPHTEAHTYVSTVSVQFVDLNILQYMLWYY